MIDLTEHEGFIFNQMRKFKIPFEERDEKFQDFAVYFYEYNRADTNGCKETTIIARVFHQFLTEQARQFNQKKRIPEKAYENIQNHNKDWLDYNIGPIIDSQEDFVMCEELFNKMSSDLQEYILFLAQGHQAKGKGLSNCVDNHPVKAIVERDGVTRQAVEKRLKHELSKLREQ